MEEAKEELRKQFEIASPFKVAQFYRFVFPKDKLLEHNFIYHNPTVHCQVKITKHPDRLKLPFTVPDLIRTALHCFCYDMQEDYGHCNILRFRVDLMHHFEDENTVPQVKGVMFGIPMTFEEENIKESVKKMEESAQEFVESLNSCTVVDVIIMAILSGCECSTCVSAWNSAKALADEQKVKDDKEDEMTIGEMLTHLDVPDKMEE
jgi:hypothetical protein